MAQAGLQALLAMEVEQFKTTLGERGSSISKLAYRRPIVNITDPIVVIPFLERISIACTGSTTGSTGTTGKRK
jgi:hypothetical protein